MIVRIQTLFRAPVFEDEDKTRSANLLYVILLVLLLLAVLTSTTILVTRGLSADSEEVFTLFSSAIVAVTIGALLILLQRGHLRVAGTSLLSMLWIIMSAWVYLTPASIGHETSNLAYVLIIVLAGLLLGKGAALVFTALSLSAILGMFCAETTGLIAFSGPPTAPFDLAFVLAPIGLTGLLLSYAVRDTAEALRRARFSECELTKSNRELSDSRMLLERQSEHLQAMVQQCVEYMAQVAQGNLTARLTLDGAAVETKDPLVALGHSLNETVSAMQGMIRQIRDTANNLSAAAAEILAVTTQQAGGANEQSAATTQATATVQQVKTIAEQSVTRAQEVADASRRTVEVSRTGQQAVHSTIESMTEIKEHVAGIAENILVLSEQTQQIDNIIATVNDLASRSALLALNAAVEAARAGEHGKGFAVVAAEVRSLAEQSKRATAQVKAIIKDIQEATDATAKTTKAGAKVVDEGVLLASMTGQVIEQLTSVIEESAHAATEMVSGGQQQALGVEQIALAMNDINRTTIRTLSSTGQAEKTAQDLNELAHRMAEIVEQYQL
jgi:methyl-accepting chemotaxis protein